MGKEIALTKRYLNHGYLVLKVGADDKNGNPITYYPSPGYLNHGGYGQQNSKSIFINKTTGNSSPYSENRDGSFKPNIDLLERLFNAIGHSLFIRMSEVNIDKIDSIISGGIGDSSNFPGFRRRVHDLNSGFGEVRSMYNAVALENGGDSTVYLVDTVINAPLPD